MEPLEGFVEPVSSEEPGPNGRVRALDQITASNLRNSQIICKVSDVVRELVENSIDADATKVQIYLVKNGVMKIEVRDNGHGIPFDDVPRIFKGGHTSKLQDPNNLTRDQCFGFKGEALSAICAVSNVTLETKPSGTNAGKRYQFNHLGSVVSEAVTSHSGGTTIIAERIFEKFPVRRQRLGEKGVVAAELKEIEAFLKGVALANPKCYLAFYNDNQLLWTKAAVQTVEQAIFAVMGHGIAKKMSRYGPVEVSLEGGESGKGDPKSRTIELHLPKQAVDMRTMSYTSNKMTLIFCNRKRVYIRDFEKLIHRYVTSVVEKPQPADQRRFPVCMFYINIPPAEADFNRDTDKTKVFLVHKDKIHEALEAALISFYGINLKDCEGSQSGAPGTVNKSHEGAVTSMEILDSVTSNVSKPDAAPKSSDPNITSNPVRQGTIASFLQDMPSTSAAFVNSPTKPVGSEAGISVSFPPSKPVVERSALGEASEDSKGEGRPREASEKTLSSVKSNFEVWIDSQELSQERSDAPMQAINVGDKVVASDSKENRIASTENIMQGWLNGRIKDKNGEIVESVIIPVTRVAAQPDQEKEKNEDYERFRKLAQTAGKTNPRDGSNHSTPFLNSEPSRKRAKLDSPGTSFQEVHRPQASAPATPFAVHHKQTTLDYFSKSATPSRIVSHTASESITGIRIPPTPKTPTGLENSLNVIANSIEKFEQITKQNLNRNPALSPNFEWLLVSRFLKETLPSLRWTPKVNGKILSDSSVGPLYLAQTETKLGIFAPGNLKRFFPEVDRQRSSSVGSSQSSSPENTDEKDVSELFSTFLNTPRIFHSMFAARIFHSVKDLKEIMDVYRSMADTCSKMKAVH